MYCVARPRILEKSALPSRVKRACSDRASKASGPGSEIPGNTRHALQVQIVKFESILSSEDVFSTVANG